MLIQGVPGLNQLAFLDARLVERTIFNGLKPSEMAVHPTAGPRLIGQDPQRADPSETEGDRL
jgi:hypothetical protein